MYKTESTLGLIGSIIASVFTFLFIVGTAFAMFFYSYFEQIVHNVYDSLVATHVLRYGLKYESLTAIVLPAIAVCAVVAIIIAAASIILGFLGTAKLNRDDRSGGVMLIVAGALSLISIVGFIPFILQIVGGIMAVSRKTAVPAQPVSSAS